MKSPKRCADRVTVNQTDHHNGRRIHQCLSLPVNLIEERAQLIEGSYPDLSLSKFAQATVACVGAHEEDAGNPLLLLLCKSLALGHKIMRHACQALRLSIEAAQEVDDPQPDLFQRFEQKVDDQEGIDGFPSVCGLQSLSA